jgi:hypothetical protein
MTAIQARGLKVDFIISFGYLTFGIIYYYNYANWHFSMRTVLL